MAIRIWQYFPIFPTPLEAKNGRTPSSIGRAQLQCVPRSLGVGPDRQSQQRVPTKVASPVIGYGFFIFVPCRCIHLQRVHFVMEWISTSTLFQFPIIQYLCLQDMRLVCKEDMIRRRGANREFWRHHAVTSYPAHEQMPRHAPNKAKPAKNGVDSKIIKILSPTTRANCSAPFATAGDHAQNHDPSLTCHLPCFQNLVLQASYKWTYIHSP